MWGVVLIKRKFKVKKKRAYSTLPHPIIDWKLKWILFTPIYLTHLICVDIDFQPVTYQYAGNPYVNPDIEFRCKFEIWTQSQLTHQLCLDPDNSGYQVISGYKKSFTSRTVHGKASINFEINNFSMNVLS